MRIALVNPVARRTEGYHTIGTRIPQLGLQVLAHLVPPEHEVDIIDEIFGSDETERLLTGGGYDLVGMTAYTSGVSNTRVITRRISYWAMKSAIGGEYL